MRREKRDNIQQGCPISRQCFFYLFISVDHNNSQLTIFFCIFQNKLKVSLVFIFHYSLYCDLKDTKSWLHVWNCEICGLLSAETLSTQEIHSFIYFAKIGLFVEKRFQIKINTCDSSRSVNICGSSNKDAAQSHSLQTGPAHKLSKICPVRTLQI